MCDINKQKAFGEIANYQHSARILRKIITAQNAYQSLIEVAILGRVRMVKWIMHRWPDTSMDVAYVRAAEHGKLRVVKYFYRRGVNLRTLDDWAMRWTAFYGHLEVVKFIHQKCPDIIFCQRLVSSAAGRGHLPIVQYLHAESMKKNFVYDKDYALQKAAAYGHIHVVQYLHQLGIDITSEGNLAVRWAAESGHLDVVKYLYAHGADIHACNEQAFRLAARKGHYELVCYLHAEGADLHACHDDAVRQAAKRGNMDVVHYLHAKGADLRAHNDYAIRKSAKHGKLEMVRYLYAHGADIRASQDYAIYLAATYGYFDVVRFLHSKGAGLSQLQRFGGKIGAYYRIKTWLQHQVSELRRLAATIYVANYAALPDAETIPDDVLQILLAVKA